MPNGTMHYHLRRAGLAAVLIVVTGCGVGPFPRRRPGSDITLPPPKGDWLIESLLGCASPVVTKGAAGARDVVTCRKATGDTVPDPKQPPPPTTVP